MGSSPNIRHGRCHIFAFIADVSLCRKLSEIHEAINKYYNPRPLKTF
ncbi:hypothetical protein J7L27_07820 [Candidatus Bathyarchaeota archaeon]|nr:hypothetical protein [Candidatus Bathyarchaeota archaeon]